MSSVRATQQVRYADLRRVRSRLQRRRATGAAARSRRAAGDSRALPRADLPEAARAGLVASKRGPGGGYQLARRPDAISPARRRERGAGQRAGRSPNPDALPARRPDFVWALLRADLARALRTRSVADLCREAAERGVPRAPASRRRTRSECRSDSAAKSWRVRPRTVEPGAEPRRAAARAPARGFPARARVLSRRVLRAADRRRTRRLRPRRPLHQRAEHAGRARRVGSRCAPGVLDRRAGVVECTASRGAARRALVVIYHSHVDTAAYLSHTDLEGALGPDGQPLYPGRAQLVVSVQESGVLGAALFEWDEATRAFRGRARALARRRGAARARRARRLLREHPDDGAADRPDRLHPAGAPPRASSRSRSSARPCAIENPDKTEHHQGDAADHALAARARDRGVHDRCPMRASARFPCDWSATARGCSWAGSTHDGQRDAALHLEPDHGRVDPRAARSRSEAARASPTDRSCSVWHGPVREGQAATRAGSGSIRDEKETSSCRARRRRHAGRVARRPDGRVLARREGRGARTLDLPRLTLGETEPRFVTRGSHPRFSRDGQWIAFARKSRRQLGRLDHARRRLGEAADHQDRLRRGVPVAVARRALRRVRLVARRRGARVSCT